MGIDRREAMDLTQNVVLSLDDNGYHVVTNPGETSLEDVKRLIVSRLDRIDEQRAFLQGALMAVHTELEAQKKQGQHSYTKEEIEEARKDRDDEAAREPDKKEG